MTTERRIPFRSEKTEPPPTAIAVPTTAMALAMTVRLRGISRNQSQARAAAANGAVVRIIATFATLVSCNDGMKRTMPIADRIAKSRPPRLILIRSRKPDRPCTTPRNTQIAPPAKTPRQNRIVNESNGSSRTNSGAVLQATAADATSAIPTPCTELVLAIAILQAGASR
jgi:hypothetical protein